MPKTKVKPRNLIKNFLLLMISLSVMLLVLEFFVAFFFPQEIVPNIVKTDNYTKYVLKENFTGVQVSQEFRVTLSTNSHGLRDREFTYEKSENAYRVLGLGDSFTFGDGVELDDIFLKVFENELNSEKPGGYENYEVINGGVYGWGTIQEYVFLRREGINYDPDMVLIGFFSQDFRDNVNTCDLLSFENGNVIIKRAERDSLMKLRDLTNSIPFYDFLSQNSHLLHLFKKFLTISMSRDTGQVTTEEMNHSMGCDAWDITTKVLLEFKKLLDTENEELIVVLIPSISELGNESFEYQRGPENETLGNFLEKNGIHFVDMLPIFRGEIKKGEELYFPIDGHCNEKGNEVMGQAIYKYVLDNKLVI